ncbi:MAG: AbiEi antitoxin N-terminal domain-containing protein [Planctomycetes bacterium]|nr:AbiEi antitoxin N-terminal domain-containing protein [Planctomycetota bacterium]
MPSPADRARNLLNQNSLAHSKELEQVGLSRSQIQRLLGQGVLERVGRGLYRLAGGTITETDDLASASKLVPGGVVCLLSALRFHGLTTQNPVEVWMTIAAKAWRPQIDHPPIRLLFMSGASLEEGVETHDLNGVTLRVFNPAKTVADCFKYRHKIGIDVAVEALRDYRRLHPKALELLWHYAKLNRVAKVMQPYLEAVQ